MSVDVAHSRAHTIVAKHKMKLVASLMANRNDVVSPGWWIGAIFE